MALHTNLIFESTALFNALVVEFELTVVAVLVSGWELEFRIMRPASNRVAIMNYHLLLR